MDDLQADTIREIERLRVLADWYRGWARVSGSEQDRTARLGLADHIEAKARTLLRQLEGSASADAFVPPATC
jgi:hypothetical protein